MTVAQPRKRLPDGAWKGLAAVKAISRHLFAVFGLDRRLKKERAKASKRLKQKAQQWALEADKTTRAGQARLALAMKAVLGKPGGKPKRKPPDDQEYRRRLNLKLVELKEKHWDWSRERLIEAAERMLFGLDPNRA